VTLRYPTSVTSRYVTLRHVTMRLHWLKQIPSVVLRLPMSSSHGLVSRMCDNEPRECGETAALARRGQQWKHPHGITSSCYDWWVSESGWSRRQHDGTWSEPRSRATDEPHMAPRQAARRWGMVRSDATRPAYADRRRNSALFQKMKVTAHSVWSSSQNHCKRCPNSAHH
jgi:hypothetical protein